MEGRQAHRVLSLLRRAFRCLSRLSLSRAHPLAIARRCSTCSTPSSPAPLSAFAFEPVGWWPLLLVAFAVLCELICRSKTLGARLLIGWAFGVGQFAVGLNWIATAFTYQVEHAGLAGLGRGGSAVALSRHLSGARDRPRLALRPRRPVVLVLVLGGAWTITEWLRGTMFTGFPWNPAAAALAPTPLITITPLIGTYGLSAWWSCSAAPSGSNITGSGCRW